MKVLLIRQNIANIV